MTGRAADMRRRACLPAVEVLRVNRSQIDLTESLKRRTVEQGIDASSGSVC